MVQFSFQEVVAGFNTGNDFTNQEFLTFIENYVDLSKNKHYHLTFLNQNSKPETSQ